MKHSVYDCSIIELGKCSMEQGSISIIENSKEVPFDIARVFYLYDIPGGESRGAHAHIKCHQFLIAVSGSFEIVLDDGVVKRTVTLNRPYMGLHILPGIWAAEQGFSSGSICLVYTSEKYDESDYIRNYTDFLALKK